MPRFAADEDFNNRILRGLLRRAPRLDVVRAQDAGLVGGEDAEVLEWAAREGRILLTHDVTTMRRAFDERAAAGLPTAGVFVVGQQVAIAQAIEDLMLIAECSLEGEWEGRIIFLPLR